MNTLSSIVPEKWIQALGWTLLHSLWQGLIAALLLGVLLLLLHRQSATIRYFVSTLTLFTFLLVTVATFVKEYSLLTETTASETAPMNYAIGFPVALTTSQPATQAETISPGFFSTFSIYFNQHLPSVVLLWALGMMVLLLRFMGGLAYSQRLKHYKTVDLSQYWQDCVQSLSEKAQIKQTVRLVESALVKVPVVIGYFKPVILLPVGTILGLPSEQIEAILAHELAHISRKDYLVNIGQCLVEILFFFHPAVWWMSSRIREEREHCCDDMALSLCGDSLTFAKALANLEGVHTGSASLALGFAGKGQSLLHRIQRLIGQPRRNPNFMEGFLAACFLMASIMAVSVSAGTALQTTTKNLSLTMEEEQSAEEKSYQPAQTLVSDSLKNKGTFTYKGSKNGRKYDVKATIENDRITKLYLDGKKVPVAEIEKYQDLVYDLMADVPVPPEPVLPPSPMTAFAPMAPVAPMAPYPSMDDLDLEPVIAPVEPLDPFEPMEPLAPIEPFDMADVLEKALNNDTTRLKNYKGNFTIVHQGKDKKEYTFRMKDGVLENLEIDNKPVPKPEYKNYSFIVDEIREDAELRQEEARERQMDARYRMEENRQRMYEESRALQGRIAADRERVIRKNNELRIQQRQQMERAIQDQRRVLREQERALEQHARAMRDHDKSMRKHQFSLELREELKKDKLIKNENNYTFKLDNKALYIDGEKQPESVYEKYKKLAEKEHGSITDDFEMEFQYKNDDK